MRGWTTTVIVAGMVGLAGSASAQAVQKFRGRLSTVPIDASQVSVIAGSGSVSAELAGTKLVITGRFEGLKSPATVARLHRGPKGIRGPAVTDLTVSKGLKGTLGGSIVLTAMQVQDLRMGRLYVQIHSEAGPDGNLWGWLLMQ